MKSSFLSDHMHHTPQLQSLIFNMLNETGTQLELEKLHNSLLIPTNQAGNRQMQLLSIAIFDSIF